MTRHKHKTRKGISETQAQRATLEHSGRAGTAARRLVYTAAPPMAAKRIATCSAKSIRLLLAGQ